MADVLTHPSPARRDAPFRGQGRSKRCFSLTSRITHHTSRVLRTPLAGIFSILLHLKLRFIQAGIDASLPHQLIVPPVFDEPPAVDHENTIDVVQCG